jgi:hypothetical protein
MFRLGCQVFWFSLAVTQVFATPALRVRQDYDNENALPTYGGYTPSPTYDGGYTPSPQPSCPSTPTVDQNYQQKLQWFLKFANAFMYPNNTIEAAKVNSTLFAENVQGRVDLTSTFDGRELNTEVSASVSFLTDKVSLRVIFNHRIDCLARYRKSSFQHPWCTHQLHINRVHRNRKPGRRLLHFQRYASRQHLAPSRSNPLHPI